MYLSMEHQGCQTDSRLLFTAPLRVGLRQGCLLWTGERTYDCGTFLETLPSAGHPGATFPRVTNECSQTPTPSTEQHHGPVARVTPPGWWMHLDAMYTCRDELQACYMCQSRMDPHALICFKCCGCLGFVSFSDRVLCRLSFLRCVIQCSQKC